MADLLKVFFLSNQNFIFEKNCTTKCTTKTQNITKKPVQIVKMQEFSSLGVHISRFFTNSEKCCAIPQWWHWSFQSFLSFRWKSKRTVKQYIWISVDVYDDKFKHMTCETWHTGVVTIFWKFQAPSSYGLGVTVLWRYFHKGSLTYWQTA